VTISLVEFHPVANFFHYCFEDFGIGLRGKWLMKWEAAKVQNGISVASGAELG
jgi:hypothetical protein